MWISNCSFYRPTEGRRLSQPSRPVSPNPQHTEHSLSLNHHSMWRIRLKPELAGINNFQNSSSNRKRMTYERLFSRMPFECQEFIWAHGWRDYKSDFQSAFGAPYSRGYCGFLMAFKVDSTWILLISNRIPATIETRLMGIPAYSKCIWNVLTEFEVACHVDSPSDETQIFQIPFECCRTL